MVLRSPTPAEGNSDVSRPEAVANSKPMCVVFRGVHCRWRLRTAKIPLLQLQLQAVGFERPSGLPEPQTFQNHFTKEYTLNHIGDPTII